MFWFRVKLPVGIGADPVVCVACLFCPYLLVAYFWGLQGLAFGLSGKCWVNPVGKVWGAREERDKGDTEISTGLLVQVERGSNTVGEAAFGEKPKPVMHGKHRKESMNHSKGVNSRNQNMEEPPFNLNVNFRPLSCCTQSSLYIDQSSLNRPSPNQQEPPYNILAVRYRMDAPNKPPKRKQDNQKTPLV